ncbi:hypothetical protein G205_00185 [Arthrobacter nitrophenolicus]|uniref:Uncharacterized protein n=1 Tax=Arthrobacter nitrophenolicus TaxID=683150 RepID=L8TTX4_9MICC|nr:hypothetical protein G205_00185 [Arthrobacter nitrophenolicus]
MLTTSAMIMPIAEAFARLAAAAGMTGFTGASPPGPAASGPPAGSAGSGLGLVFSCMSFTPL